MTLRTKPSYWWPGGMTLLALMVGAPFNAAGLAVLAVAVLLWVRMLNAWERLELDAEGFTIVATFFKRRESWADIESFQVVTWSYMFIPVRRMVGYRYRSSKQRSAVSKVVGSFNGWDQVLPETYGMKAQALGQLLDQWRAESAARGAAATDRAA